MTEITKEEMRSRLGNITQLQELLFGDKSKQYDLQFNECEKRLTTIEAGLEEFKTVVEERLEKLENSFTKEIDSVANSLEKKLKYLSLTTQEETTKLSQEIATVSQVNYDEVNALRDNINSQTNNLKTELVETKKILEQDLKTLKQQISEKLSRNITELSEGKVSRADLADILFELCIKVKGTEFVPDLKEAADNQMKTDFILPEDQSDNKEESN